MHKIIITFLSIILLSYGTFVAAGNNSEQFPKRQYYPQLNYIDTQTFVRGLEKNRYDVIDVRSDAQFKALHVKSATHIMLKNRTFEQDILAFVKQSKKPLVVYCNGYSCDKSYEASNKIMTLFKKEHIEKKIFTYDSGINAIAYAHNKLVLKNGKKVSKDNPLADIKKVREHTLKPHDFEQYLASHQLKEYALLDIRDISEKNVIKLFMLHREKNITLDQRNKLITFLNKIKKQNKTLLVYDASGGHINDLYELLTFVGIKDWHYMEKGESGFSEYVLNSAGLES